MYPPDYDIHLCPVLAYYIGAFHSAAGESTQQDRAPPPTGQGGRGGGWKWWPDWRVALILSVVGGELWLPTAGARTNYFHDLMTTVHTWRVMKLFIFISTFAKSTTSCADSWTYWNSEKERERKKRKTKKKRFPNSLYIQTPDQPLHGGN